MGKTQQGRRRGAATPEERRGVQAPPLRRVEALLFFLLFFAYAYFCPGGGWNQNARFDQARAIVEGGTFAINDFLVFGRTDQSGAGSSSRLARRPLPPDTAIDQVWRIGNTGDVTRRGDRVYPGKPPGTVLLAVPAYWILYQIEKRLGIDPDDWRPLTVNAYLTRLFSVGLITALGGVAYFRLSHRLFPGVRPRSHLLATLALGLATICWPFATLFFDHNIVAVLLLVAFLLLVQVQDEGTRNREQGTDLQRYGSALRLVGAGALLGAATVCNYLAVIPIAIFSVYAVVTLRPVWRVLWLWAGGVAPALLLAWYHAACFGSFTATANTDEPGMFQDTRLWLGMFGKPDPTLLHALLFSSYRGLFFLSPVLLIALAAALYALISRRRRAEMIVCLATFAAYVAMNASFQGWSKAWTGGWSYGPRYLIPGMALLALPLCLAFERLPRITLALAGYSFLLMLLGTAVDPQPPVDIKQPIGDYLWPLAQGRTVKNGKAEIVGAVSANPIGVYEAFYYRLFPRGSDETRWNSFNLGEFIWPERRLSLLPLIGILGIGVGILWRWTRANHRGTKMQRN